jgi:signal transduction histidine kinase
MKSLLTRVFLGLRFRLLLLVLLACAPLVVLALHSTWEDQRRELAEWQQRSLRLAQIAKQEEEDLVGETRQLLLAVAESSPVRSNNRRGAKRLLDEVFTSYPRYANLSVVQTNGVVLASAVPLSETLQTNYPFFHRAIQTQGFSIGRVPATNGASLPALQCGYPVFDRTGAVQAVVIAGLELPWLGSATPDISALLPKEAFWAELDHRGLVLAHYPASEDGVGGPFPHPHLIRTAFTQTNGVLEAVDAHGVPWVYAFASLQSKLGGEVETVLGIPRSVLFAQSDLTLRRNMIWSGLAIALALSLGWLGGSLLIVRPVKTLVRSSARLASGDLSARTGLTHRHDELGQLITAFDRMAQALEERDTERLRLSQKLQGLSHRLVEVQESERRHIARELHDEIGQSLTAAEMNLQAALQASGTAGLERRLEDSIQAVERVLEQVHDLSLNLRPSMLDDLGLVPALRWYTHRQAALTELKVDFQVKVSEDRLDPFIETECFRVAQEALTNVVRHAQAHGVAVELTKKENYLHLYVRDDGEGFDVSQLRERAVNGASLGLLSMEERATLTGGGIEYLSTVGKGTEVHAWFPFRLRDQETIVETNE